MGPDDRWHRRTAVVRFFFHVRTAHVPTLKEAAKWSALYVGIAVLFGLGVLMLGGSEAGSEYFAGYVTEKALSVDNLFVFLIIMASFRQHGRLATRGTRLPSYTTGTSPMGPQTFVTLEAPRSVQHLS